MSSFREFMRCSIANQLAESKMLRNAICLSFMLSLNKSHNCLLHRKLWSLIPNTGADPGILVRGGVGVAGSTDQQNLFFKFIYFIDFITFRYTKPGYLNCSYAGVSKKWTAIFVPCIVPEIYFCFWSSPETYLISVVF